MKPQPTRPPVLTTLSAKQVILSPIRFLTPAPNCAQAFNVNLSNSVESALTFISLIIGILCIRQKYTVQNLFRFYMLFLRTTLLLNHLPLFDLNPLPENLQGWSDLKKCMLL